MAAIFHLLKERKPEGCTTKCGLPRVDVAATIGFASAVTCTACLAAMRKP